MFLSFAQLFIVIDKYLTKAVVFCWPWALGCLWRPWALGFGLVVVNRSSCETLLEALGEDSGHDTSQTSPILKISTTVMSGKE